jgi:hypothetical protein
MSSGSLSSGNPVRFMGHAIIAYVDILGMSSAICNNWSAESCSSLHRFLRIKESLPVDDGENPPGFNYYDSSEDNGYELHFSKTRTLSDSIVTMIALPPSLSECTSLQFYARVWNILFCLRSIWHQALKEGFTIRGGIELGEMFWNEEEFIGPGLVYSHFLENRIAKTSRVLIGPTLANFIVKYNNPAVPGESPINVFAVSNDGNIIVDPHFVFDEGFIERLETLQQNAGSDQNKNKYDELINMLKMPKEQVKHPSLEDMSSYIVGITAKYKEVLKT